MTDNNCSGWGQVLAGGLIGYLFGANGGGFFGNGCNRNGNCGSCGENCKVSAIQTRVDDLMSGQDTKAILDATIAGASQVRSDIETLTKQVYDLNIQQLINDQANQRNLDNQFCQTRERVTADGSATRASIDIFKQLYQTDRYNDLARENVELKNKINIMPLECAIGAVNAKLDSVIGCAGVRTCGNSCGGHVGYSNGFPYYAVPPVGTFELTKSYNPNVPTTTGA